MAGLGPLVWSPAGLVAHNLLPDLDQFRMATFHAFGTGWYRLIIGWTRANTRSPTPHQREKCFTVKDLAVVPLCLNEPNPAARLARPPLCRIAGCRVAWQAALLMWSPAGLVDHQFVIRSRPVLDGYLSRLRELVGNGRTLVARTRFPVICGFFWGGWAICA